MSTSTATFMRRTRNALLVLTLLSTAPLGGDSPRLAAADESASGPAKPADGKQTVILELSEEPSSATYDRAIGRQAEPKKLDERAARQAAQAQSVRIQRQQDRLAAILSHEPFNADLVYRSERTSNRLAIRIDPAHLSRVRGLPGVRSVQVLR